ncbi:Pkinase-domain-containing protein [Flagelloscypha sp. PMI_526]|nr:Pkinase-domain-containing protein [Flagelloscypha sp. PMI_526]
MRESGRPNIVNFLKSYVMVVIEFMEGGALANVTMKTQIGRIKITYFGSYTKLTDTKSKRAMIMGIPYGIAPEFVKPVEYSEKVGIWSLGIMVNMVNESGLPYVDGESLKAPYLVATNKNQAQEIRSIVQKGSQASWRSVCADVSSRATYTNYWTKNF